MKTTDYDSMVSEMPDDEGPLVGAEVELDEGDDLADISPALDEGADRPDPKFDDNLADKLTESDRIQVGLQLKEMLDVDVESRRRWESRLLNGLEVIGLEDVPSDRTAFEGAASVTHPAIAEAIVQFQARAVEELLPASGPVKCGVVGDADEEDEARASRVEEYMNYQLTDEDDEYYSDTDAMLFYLPYAGSAFKKVGIDPITGTTRARYITAEDFIVPYSARSLRTATRYTHRYTISLNSFKRSVARGSFLDADFESVLAAYNQSAEARRLEDASDERDTSYHQDDHDLVFCETHIDWDFEWEKEGGKVDYLKPYVITWEWETGTVVSIRRLWAQDDETCQKEVWFVHYKYLPGFGFYGLGLLHLIGALGKAASGALRAVLDGSTTASLQGGFKSKDAKIAGDVTFAAGQWIDTDMTADEMQKAFYTPPFKEPSTALFQTLEILLSGIQRFTSTTEAMVGDASNTGPVGTTVALIEQGSKIFSGIHRRLHQACRIEFKLIAYCNWRYMDRDEYPYKVSGADRSVLRDDFAPGVDVIPVSDPNIFSSTQRIALAQAVLQMTETSPDVFSKKGRIKAAKNMLTALRVAEVDDYIEEDKDMRLEPVSENQCLMLGRPVKAFPEQDHAAHMQVHANFMQEVMAIGDPEVINRVVPAIKAHISAHFAMMYRQRMEAELMQKIGVPLPAFNPLSDEPHEELSIEIENAIARAVAANVAPPAPAQAPADEQAAADEAAQRDQARKDMAAQKDIERGDAAFSADQRRKDAELMARLRSEGIIPDEPLTPEPDASTVTPAPVAASASTPTG